jgi:integrase
MAVSKTKDGRYYVVYRQPKPENKNYRKKEYFGRGAAGLAAATARDKELNLKRHGRKNADYGALFAELAKEYLAAGDFNVNAKKHLKIRLVANILPFFGHRPAIRLTDADLDAYVKTRREKVWRHGKKKKVGVKNSTIRRELTDIQAILNFSVSRRPPLLSFNPVAKYKKPAADDAIIAPPTATEARAIMGAAAPHLKRAIMLSWYLGLRPGAVELLSLNWDAVNFEAQTILVISAHKGGPASRLVPIESDEFLKTLKTWRALDKKKRIEYIVHYQGRPVKNIGKAWRATVRRAGIKRRLRPYDLRHHFVTAALAAGADLKALSDVVGSRPETLVKHYQHVTGALHRAAVAKIPELMTDE